MAGYAGIWYLHSRSATASEQAALQNVAPIPPSTASVFSTTTPKRIISALSVADAVPAEGKLIAADLENMEITLYENGVRVAAYPILTKGRPGSPYETPGGFYTVLSMESLQLNNREQVYLPYSMQFYGNYLIHGWPYYADGTPVASTYSGGCIRLGTADAKEVFTFAEKGTKVFVYDPAKTSLPPVVLGGSPAPNVSAASYLVADIDTGDVFLEQGAQDVRPIASITKLMTALVANETIMYHKKIGVSRGALLHPQNTAATLKETFAVGDLFYPLLMESNNTVADQLAAYYGTAGFIGWMNTAAKALGMQATHFADASGMSSENVSTPDDLYRLAAYLVSKKKFVLDITRTPTKQLVADSGASYRFGNFNVFSDSAAFVGGKVGQTAAAQETMVSVFSLPVEGDSRRIAIVVLRSRDYADDTTKLVEWFTRSSEQGAALSGAACASCTDPATYRKIR